jgi:hypothetical protein
MVASTTASQASRPCAFSLDLIYQDHRVPGDHAGERQHAEYRHEAKRLVRDEEGRNDPQKTQRSDAEHQEQPVEALELDHQHREDQDQHHRQHGGDRILCLAALIDCPADIDTGFA